MKIKWFVIPHLLRDVMGLSVRPTVCLSPVVLCIHEIIDLLIVEWVDICSDRKSIYFSFSPLSPDCCSCCYCSLISLSGLFVLHAQTLEGRACWHIWERDISPVYRRRVGRLRDRTTPSEGSPLFTSERFNSIDREKRERRISRTRWSACCRLYKEK